mmetsp:Transcript_18959/g.36673  ORF Transcript_18959/g.36673 Transcript_18959/m.36673 type:complete len:650 (+) Transcript_18959:216-2165(+)
MSILVVLLLTQNFLNASGLGLRNDTDGLDADWWPAPDAASEPMYQQPNASDLQLQPGQQFQYLQDLSAETPVIDVMENGKKMSPSRLGNPVSHGIAYALVAIAGTVAIGALFHACFGPSNDERNKTVSKERIKRVLKAYVIVWIGLLGLSIVTACTSVYVAQGLIRTSPSHDAERVTKGFRHDDNFVPACIVGALCIWMLTATFVTCKFILNDTANVEPLGVRDAPMRRRNDIDHFKYFLVVLIVVHHLGPNLNQTAIMSYVGQITAYVALPGFVLVSGYNSKSTELNLRRMQRVMKLAICYYWCQGLTILYWWFVIRPIYEDIYGKERAQSRLLWMLPEYSGLVEGGLDGGLRMDLESFIKQLFYVPLGTLWYLQTLVGWLLVIPFWMTFRYPVSMAVLLTMTSGYIIWGNDGFPKGRFFMFLPFFVLGAAAKKHKYDKIFFELAADPYFTAASVSLIFCSLAYAMKIDYPFDYVSKFYPTGAHGIWRFLMGDNQKWYPIGTVGALAHCTSLCCATIAVMPTQSTYFSRVSKYSLVPYILHFYVWWFLNAVGFYGSPEDLAAEKKLSPVCVHQFTSILVALVAVNVLYIPAVASRLWFILMVPVSFLFEPTVKSPKERITHTQANEDAIHPPSLGVSRQGAEDIRTIS